MKAPGKRKTRPGGVSPETGCCEKRPFTTTPAGLPQGVSDPLLAITVLWLSLGSSARTEFLEDVLFSDPALCACLERDGGSR